MDTVDVVSRSSADSGIGSLDSPPCLPCSSSSVSLFSSTCTVDWPTSACALPLQSSTDISRESSESRFVPTIVDQNRRLEIARTLIAACDNFRGFQEVRRILNLCCDEVRDRCGSVSDAELPAFIAHHFGGPEFAAELKAVKQKQTELPIGTFGDECCRWSGCTRKYQSVDLLWDHLLEKHVEPARADETGESLRCQWHRCRLLPERGDRMRKYNWLVTHVNQKHVAKAKTFRCCYDDCDSRYRSSKALQEHVKSAHLETLVAPKPRKAKEDQEWPVTKNGQPISDTVDPAMFVPPQKQPMHRDLRFRYCLNSLKKEAATMQKPRVAFVPNAHYASLKGAARRRARSSRRMCIYDAVDEAPPVRPPTFSSAFPLKIQSHLDNIFTKPRVRRPPAKRRALDLSLMPNFCNAMGIVLPESQ